MQVLALRRSLLLAGIAVLVGADGFLMHALSAPRELRIEVLTAGKSNAVLVTAPSGRRLLYGAGSDAAILRALGEALPYGARSIDVLVVPGAAAAERGGEPFIRARYQVGYELTPQNALRGERIDLGGAALEVLFPDRTLAGGGSVVLAVEAASSSALLDHASPAINAWLKVLDEKSGPRAAITISTSTPPGVYLLR